MKESAFAWVKNGRRTTLALIDHTIRSPKQRTRFKTLAHCQISMMITPYYASLMRSAGMDDPVYAQVVPQEAELHDPPCLSDDPLGEDQVVATGISREVALEVNGVEVLDEIHGQAGNLCDAICLPVAGSGSENAGARVPISSIVDGVCAMTIDNSV